MSQVCIIGAGVAGIVLASELARHGVEVLMLETGRRHDPTLRFEYMKRRRYRLNPWKGDNPEQDKFTVGGYYRYPLNSLRVKAVGGTGLHWGGNVDRLHESDFELYTRYGMGVDWPIGYDELEPYYARAEKIMGVAGQDAYPWTPWRSGPYPMPPFLPSYADKILKDAFDKLGVPLYANAVARNSVSYDGRPACMSYAMCDTCPIFAKWTPEGLLAEAEAAGKVVVRPNTRVTRINCNQTGTAVESLSVVSFFNGRLSPQTIYADAFILAAHAVESARLLLLSKSACFPQGIGNDAGHVGKYFTDHPGIIVTAELEGKTYPERIGFETSISHYFYESGRQSGTTAFTLSPMNRYVQPPLQIVNDELQKRIIWGNELQARVQERFGHMVAITALVEQLPHEANHISLDKLVTDDMGLPVPKITYSVKQNREERTIQKAVTVIRQIFEALKAKNVKIDKIGPSAHHMGICRMGDDPRSSVVDSNLRIHGMRNLYVVGSSVFPTFGAVGPTLTISALALRLGDHIASAHPPAVNRLG